MIERIVYIGALAILALAQTIQFLIMKRNGKKQGDNPNGKPGKAEICIENGKKLARLETKMEDVQGDIKDIYRWINK